MTLPLSTVICLSFIQLCMGDQPVEEVIATSKWMWMEHMIDHCIISLKCSDLQTCWRDERNTHGQTCCFFPCDNISLGEKAFLYGWVTRLTWHESYHRSNRKKDLWRPIIANIYATCASGHDSILTSILLIFIQISNWRPLFMLKAASLFSVTSIEFVKYWTEEAELITIHQHADNFKHVILPYM